MTQLYQFQYAEMEFSKDGQLDELIALDRYTVPTYDGYLKGDTVVAIVDEDLQTKKVCEIINFDHRDDEVYLELKDRFGESHIVRKDLTHKPLELKPSQLWTRWAKAGASVEENPELKEFWENEFRWLMDGFRYSLGGRIQLMLGQEYVTGELANLTAYNCFVARTPKGKDSAVEQFLEVLDVAWKEASIMRRGGGVGLNISEINTVKGTGKNKTQFVFYLDESHKDQRELKRRIKLNKLDSVTVVTTHEEFEKHVAENVSVIEVEDSVDEMFVQNMKDMVIDAYDKNVEKILVNFNALRERNALVKSLNARSSGSVSWMEFFALIASILQLNVIDNVDFAEIFSSVVHLIIQGGSRRGALMLICADDNQNVFKFIERKKEKDQFGKGKWLTGANISVGISDSYMTLVKEGRKLRDENKLTIASPGVVRAMKLWDIMIESAFKSAEPGIVWMERYNKESNSWYFHIIVATNP